MRKKQAKPYKRALPEPCSRCGNSIVRGDMFIWDGVKPKGTGFYMAHESCYRSDSPAPPAPAPTPSPAPTPDYSGYTGLTDLENKVADLEVSLVSTRGEANEARAKVDSLEEAVALSIGKVKHDLEEVAKKVESSKPIEITFPDATESVTIDNPHDSARETLTWLGLEHVYLHGPTGSGKTHFALDYAQKRERPWFYLALNRTVSDIKLVGYQTANGETVKTKLWDCLKEGGTLILDEADNASGNFMTALNGILSNKIANLCGINVPVHNDFRCICTGNTCGRGSDYQYTDRSILDTALLNRLAFVHWPYDEQLEARITLSINPDAEPWLRKVQAIRKALDSDTELNDRVASPRASYEGAKILLHNPELPLGLLAESLIYKGLDKETKLAIEERI